MKRHLLLRLHILSVLLVPGLLLAQEEGITVTLPGGGTMEMAWIESGRFLMGSPSSEGGRHDNEGPQREVTFPKGFYLGKVEVTQGQWQGVMGTAPWGGQERVQANLNYPAVCVSWDDAQEFVHRLNVAAGDSVYRLPTEAEWEYACRAGTTTQWSFGDDEGQLQEYAWYHANAWYAGEQYAHKVGTKKANPWGLYDMHGNVWEWCQDWWGSYRISAVSGSARVYRGGTFNSYPGELRSANRGFGESSTRECWIGFRILRQAS